MVKKLQQIPEMLLMGPGPSTVPPEVYQALSAPTLGHMDPRFIDIMDAIKADMQTILNTGNRCTVPMSGTGSAGMETCFVNLVEKGDKVLILINGVFGRRMQDVASRLGAEVDALEFEWGTPVLVDEVQKKLEQSAYKIVAVVHAETSTGVLNPVDQIGALLKGSDTLFLVDCVTSMGGVEIRMDDWGIDALYSGSQKCLSCPPGIAPVSFSGRAVQTLQSRKTKVPNWYLDLSMIIQYWGGASRVYHHTAPINMLYALYQALELILDEGLEQVYKRHKDMHKLLAAELEQLGLQFLVEENYRLPQLNAMTIPEGIDEAQIRSKLLLEDSIEIGGGLGPLAGKIWRIGLMGYTAQEENIHRLVTALKKYL